MNALSSLFSSLSFMFDCLTPTFLSFIPHSLSSEDSLVVDSFAASTIPSTHVQEILVYARVDAMNEINFMDFKDYAFKRHYHNIFSVSPFFSVTERWKSVIGGIMWFHLSLGPSCWGFRLIVAGFKSSEQTASLLRLDFICDKEIYRRRGCGKSMKKWMKELRRAF